MRDVMRRWLVASLLPYAIYLVGYVFESRAPGRDMPVIKDQSLAFLPGDAGLALLVASTDKIATPTPRRRMAGLLLGIVAFVVIRRVTYSPSDYSPKAWRSPTKLYHDVVVCGVFSYMIVVRVLPFYAGTPISHKTLQKLLGLTGLLTWAVGVVWDELHDVVPNDRQHPDTWRPLWSR